MDDPDQSAIFNHESVTKAPKDTPKGHLWGWFFGIFNLPILFFGIVFLSFRPLWNEIDYGARDILGIDFNVVYLILGIWAACQAYGISLLLRAIYSIRKTGSYSPRTINKIVTPILFTGLLGFLILIIVEVSFLAMMVGIPLLLVFPFIMLGWIPVLIFIGTWIARRIYHLMERGSRRINLLWRINLTNETLGKISGVFLLALFVLSFLAPFLVIPAIVLDGPLPQKPGIIAHRGASHYAPENTIAAVEAAGSMGAVGWEVDITISADGVPFLMHDDTLRRTTNVEEIFPERADQEACTFTMAELKQLDAGSWFLEDPYGTIQSGEVPQVALESYKGVKIPTLVEALSFSREHDMIVDIDDRAPPSNHPFQDSFREILAEVLNQSGLQQKIWFSSSSAAQINATRMCSGTHSLETIKARNCCMINTGVGISRAELREFLNAGFPVVVYTIDDPLTFSEFWGLGVTYIKSSRPWVLIDMDAPQWMVSRSVYLILFATLELGVGIIMIGLIRKNFLSKGDRSNAGNQKIRE